MLLICSQYNKYIDLEIFIIESSFFFSCICPCFSYVIFSLSVHLVMVDRKDQCEELDAVSPGHNGLM